MLCRHGPPHRRAFLATGIAALAAAAAPARAGAVTIGDLVGLSGELTALARNMDGSQITLRGYLAPALRPRPDRLLLTEASPAPCGLCGAPHDPGAGLVVIFAEAPEAPPELAEVSGVLRLGPSNDPDSGRILPLALVDSVLRAV